MRPARRLLLAAGVALLAGGLVALATLPPGSASGASCEGFAPMCGLDAGFADGARTFLRFVALGALLLGAVAVAAGARRA